LKRYLAARRVKIPILNDQQIKARERLARTSRAPPNEQPECVVGGVSVAETQLTVQTLMPFQIEGFQWLTYKHLKRESCILADDMGLGKTWVGLLPRH
jgi:SNF2 family DNA or RNA helicase